jgi:hypothetical protein
MLQARPGRAVAACILQKQVLHSFTTVFVHARSSKSSAIERSGDSCHKSPAEPSPDSSSGRSSPNSLLRPRRACSAATENQGDLHKNRRRREPRRQPRHSLLTTDFQLIKPVPAVISLGQPRERSWQCGRSGPEAARGQKMAWEGGSTWAGTARAQTTAGRRSVPRRLPKSRMRRPSQRPPQPAAHRQVGRKRPRHDGRRLAQTVRQTWRLQIWHCEFCFRDTEGGGTGNSGRISLIQN